MKKLYFIMGIIVAIIFAGIFSYNKFLSTSTIKVITNEKLTSKMDIYTSTGKKISMSDFGTKYKVLFYLSDSDTDYETSLKTINKITSIYDSKNITYMILWKDKISREKVKKYKINLDINYSLNNRSSLSLGKSGSIILDKYNKVTFVSTCDYVGLAKEILNIFNMSESKVLINKVNMELMNDFTINNKINSKINNKKSTLLIFSNVGCSKCKTNENIISQNIDLLKNKMNVITIKSDFSSTPEYDKNPVIDYSDVYFWAYSKAYNISTPPLYVILDKNEQVYGYYTEAKDLVFYAGNLK